jgi:hypothetical protein
MSKKSTCGTKSAFGMLGVMVLGTLGWAPQALSQDDWAESARAWLGPAPVLTQPNAVPHEAFKAPRKSLTVDTRNRSAVTSLFNSTYLPALQTPIDWTGSIAGCVAGTTSQAHVDATFEMVNYYRAMAGLPGDVVEVTSLLDDCQETALMMIAEGSLSHSPPSSWSCYTPEGAAAAGSSNLALGNHGPSAIVAYMRDSGAGNAAVGHRRWILYPPQNAMGTGSNDAHNLYHGANGLYVFASFGPRPTGPDVVAWPPPGYVPYQVVYDRWSLSLNTSPNASYANASVTMTEDGFDIPLSVVSRTDPYGDTAIVWEPLGLAFGPGQNDRTVTVEVSGVSGQALVAYDVTIIDPALNQDVIFGDDFESGTLVAWSP